jgi:hypothetical protein
LSPILATAPPDFAPTRAVGVGEESASNGDLPRGSASAGSANGLNSANGVAAGTESNTDVLATAVGRVSTEYTGSRSVPVLLF